MNSSLKIGAVSGLVAGFILGVVTSVVDEVSVSLGLWEPWWRPVIGLRSIGVNIPLGIICGIILGIIYSRVHEAVPKKGIFKGLVYGLILFVIVPIRIQTFNLAYGQLLNPAGGIFSGFFMWISYGLVLGFLYRFLQGRYYPSEKELEVRKYDMKGGIRPGAIAGFMGGVAASIVAVLGTAVGLLRWIGQPAKLTFDFWMGQAGTHIVLNMVWCTVFGFVFPRVYDLVPSKGVKKGLIYGLLVYVIAIFPTVYWYIITAAFHNYSTFLLAYRSSPVISLACFIVFGLVLGALYKKPSD